MTARPQFLELPGSNTGMIAQMQLEAGPVVLINSFVVPDGQFDVFLENWKRDAGHMRAQPGAISAQLHRGVGSSSLVVNIAVWETTEAFRKAFKNPEFQKHLAHFPEGTISYGHLFEKVAVAGICTA